MSGPAAALVGFVVGFVLSALAAAWWLYRAAS